MILSRCGICSYSWLLCRLTRFWCGSFGAAKGLHRSERGKCAPLWRLTFCRLSLLTSPGTYSIWLLLSPHENCVGLYGFIQKANSMVVAVGTQRQNEVVTIGQGPFQSQPRRVEVGTRLRCMLSIHCRVDPAMWTVFPSPCFIPKQALSVPP